MSWAGPRQKVYLSHGNQLHDKFVEKSNKAAKVESLALMRNEMFVRNCGVGQWGLVHVELYAVRE